MALALVAASPDTGAPAVPVAAAEHAAVPARECPYHFRSDMPPGLYCVYRGRALAADGTVCARDVVVIWSAHARRGGAAAAADGAGAPAGEVYLGFVSDPSLVVHAVAGHDARGELLTYRLDPDTPPRRLSGVTSLDSRGGGASGLTLAIRAPGGLVAHPGACAMAVYRGAFVGVLDLSGEGELLERAGAR